MRRYFVFLCAALLSLAASASAQTNAPLTRTIAEAATPNDLAQLILGPLGKLYSEALIGPACPDCALNSVTFYTTPKAVLGGICSAQAMTVYFRPEAPAAGRDAPVVATDVFPRNVFSIRQQGEGYACDGPMSARRLFLADSEYRATRGLAFLRKVVASAQGQGALPFILACEDERCGNTRDTLARLNVENIGQVEFIRCNTPTQQSRECYAVSVYEDAYNYWRLIIDAPEAFGADNPRSVTLSHWTLPPI
jgi:hypothetical protein